MAGAATTTRTALWSLLTPVLLAAGHLGIVDVGEQVLIETADRLDEVAEASRPSSESFVNPAKVLAADLAEGVPVVLGDGALSGVAAQRAASMLARTARMPATWGELPDDAAQVVACFDGPFTAAYTGGAPAPRRDDDDIFADPFLDGPASPRLALLMLRDAAPDPMTPEADENAAPGRRRRPPRRATSARGCREVVATPGPRPDPAGRPDRHDRLRRDLPRAGPRARPGGLAARRRPRGAHRPHRPLTRSSRRASGADRADQLDDVADHALHAGQAGHPHELVDEGHDLAHQPVRALLALAGVVHPEQHDPHLQQPQQLRQLGPDRGAGP